MAILLKGSTITLKEKSVSGTDPFGQSIYTYTDKTVENVLISTLSANELVDSHSFRGKKHMISIAVPKGDTHTWEGSKVVWRGRTYTIIGPAKEAEEDKVPLDWNKTYTGEYYE